MKAKLIVKGKEFLIEIQDPELEKLLRPKKRTGYERVERGSVYFYTSSDASVGSVEDEKDASSNDDYDAADYYSDRTVAENNARADKLMRQLRRFAVEHREKDINWCRNTCKYYIFYDHNNNLLDTIDNQVHETYGTIYFDSAKSADAAIETFHDELIWYFTEYKDSL